MIASLTGAAPDCREGWAGVALDPTNPRDAVIAAGRHRLLTQGIEAIRALLNASALSRDVPVSRDTAYRVFRGEADCDSVTDVIVMAVAEAAHELAWSGAAAAEDAAFEAYARCNSVATGFQLEPSAQAPWTSTIVGLLTVFLSGSRLSTASRRARRRIHSSGENTPYLRELGAPGPRILPGEPEADQDMSSVGRCVAER